MQHMEIIPATIDHANAIGRIGAASWQAAYKGIIPDSYLANVTPERRAAHIRKLLPLAIAEYYLFRVDGEDAGNAAIGRRHDEGVAVTIGEIGGFYFLPEFWGRGYPGEAMPFCVARLKELGFSAITIWVLEENLRARRFYEKHGFALNGNRKEITLGKPLMEVQYQMDFIVP